MTIIDLWPLMAIVALFALNIMIPGANFIWISRMSLDHGRSSGWRTSLGATFGDMLYASVSLAGLSTLITKEPMALPLLGLIGGLWLAYCGARMLLLPTTLALDAEERRDHKVWPFWKAFKSGLLVNLTNPQSLIFFSAILVSGLPQGPSAAQGFVLMVGFLAVSLSVRGSVAWLFATKAVREAYIKLKRPMNMASGIALLAFGVKTALHAAPFWTAYAKAISLTLPVFV